MSDPKKPSIALWITAVIVAVVMLPFLYLAALGPLFFLLANGTIDQQMWEVLAQPATLWGEHIGYRPDWFWDLCEAYIEWWSNLAQ